MQGDGLPIDCTQLVFVTDTALRSCRPSNAVRGPRTVACAGSVAETSVEKR
jgi:hypothetical protein